MSVPAVHAVTMDDVDRSILAFEAENTHWKYQGAREAAIRQRFDLTPTAYAQRVVRLLSDPAAYAADPSTVQRLRRIRDQRGQARRRGA